MENQTEAMKQHVDGYREKNVDETLEGVLQEQVAPSEQQVPTQEQLEKEMTCQHCHSKLVSKAELTGAVQFIHATLNTFRDRVDNLMGTQAKKVLKAIIESPLEKEITSFTTKEQQKAFELGIAINSAKYVLFQGSKNHYDELAGDIKEQMDTEDNGAASEEVNSAPQIENNEGEVNG